MTRAALYLEGKTPSLNDRLANLAISGDIMSVDSLSRDAGMTSSGDDFCGSNRMTSATSVAATVNGMPSSSVGKVFVTSGYPDGSSSGGPGSNPGESTSMVWPTLGSRTAKEQNGTVNAQYASAGLCQ